MAIEYEKKTKENYDTIGLPKYISLPMIYKAKLNQKESISYHD
jgi:hypothetical protein